MSGGKLAGVENFSGSRGASLKFLAIPGSNSLLPKNPIPGGVRLGRTKNRKGQTRDKKHYYPFHTRNIDKKGGNN
jgi:hypothetical protein